MTINFTYSTKMVVVFDEEYEVPHNGTLTEAVCIVKNGFYEYGFDKADIIDAETGEVLAMAEND